MGYASVLKYIIYNISEGVTCIRELVSLGSIGVYRVPCYIELVMYRVSSDCSVVNM